MEETFFDWKCPRCGYTAQMTYPCLYHDRELGLMICLTPGQNKIALQIPKYLDKVAKRAVFTLPQLKEKILLFESGLDDAAMERVDKALSEVVQKKWRIPEVTAPNLTFISRRRKCSGRFIMNRMSDSLLWILFWPTS